MRKKLLFGLLAILFVMSSLKSFAQKRNPLRFGFGLNAGATVKDPPRFVLGIDGRLQIPLGNSFSAIATTGYYHFFENSDYANGGIVPVKGGLKYFPAKNIYVAGEAGVGFALLEDNTASFVYSPSVGLAFVNGFDISLKYENYTKFKGAASQLALRFAYGFKL